MHPEWMVRLGVRGREPRGHTPSGFNRTRVLGFSVVHNAWTQTRAALDDASHWELKWYTGGSVDCWADSSNICWTYNGADPVNTGGLIDPVGGSDVSSAVDRVILVVSGLNISTANGPVVYPPGGYSSDQSVWQGYISSAITNIRFYHPNVRQIVLQPNVGGPGSTTCVDVSHSSFSQPYDVVRCTFTHPIILAACNALVSSDVKVGQIALASACSNFSDWAGHQTSAGYDETGFDMGHHYNENN